MKKLSLASFLGLTLLSTASCSSKGGNDDGIEGGDARPQEGEWEKVVTDLPFPLDGDGKINTITIGRKEFDGNYANRGNVEVYFDLDKPVIQIEMRIYDFADDLNFNGDDQGAIEGTRNAIALWAYKTSSNPMKPEKMDAEDDCTMDTWKDGCSVYVYYNGQTQPLRAGADLRVHLPKAYRGKLNVETEDNLNEAAYPRLGNVTIDGWCSSGEVRMSSGTAKVKLCRDLQVAPTCAAADIKTCDTFKDEMGKDAAWSKECPCAPDIYGQIKVYSLKPWAADITVDMPNKVWTNVNLSNDEPGKPNNCKPELPNCTGSICTPMASSEYSVSGEFNYPSPAAASGAGFNLTVLSAGCGPVHYYDSPDDWLPDDMSTPKEDEHGHVKVCTGCL